MICRANPLIGFYMMRTLVVKRLEVLFTCHVLTVYKKNGNFHFSVPCFFYNDASINSVQAAVVQFPPFCSSRLSFRIVFDNFSKNLIICPQHFNILMISNRSFTAVPPVIEISAKFILLYTGLSQHPLETQEKVFS